MKRIVLLALLLCMSYGLQAQWGKKIKGNGNVITQERETAEYEEIAVAGWFDVILVNGREGEITLKGEENLLEYVETEVDRGKLTVKEKKGVNLKPSKWKDGIVVTIPVEQIEAISLSGSGDVSSRTVLKSDRLETAVSGSGDIALEVESDKVKANVSGSGNISLKGKTKELEIRMSGSGDLDAFDLDAEDVEVQVSGSADVNVMATKSLKANVSGSGDIHYKGNPKKIDSKKSGSGEITKA
ncbi:head GIN domain-containing protein [Zeaxanthinibacter enoshimensis]|uniref:Putative autotransporter adhesin-like protein n=1 Tax=Zeaxanthinibacter enoshimensis TaxID=392009 RepID=A0A4R6TJF4_9FLAO|nr:head GIN domain-containing protein [Zeaxanthinibacter enoshimensis]TDQ30994.1 putative autotransporter adhesin-like protein [Zeaxanthinibacter enoshimensis]